MVIAILFTMILFAGFNFFQNYNISIQSKNPNLTSTVSPTYNRRCQTNSDCILADKKFAKDCSIQTCDLIDYSKDNWIPVNQKSRSMFVKSGCPKRPTVVCNSAFIQSHYATKCIELICRKIAI